MKPTRRLCVYTTMITDVESRKTVRQYLHSLAVLFPIRASQERGDLETVSTLSFVDRLVIRIVRSRARHGAIPYVAL